jgi:hypothetical protein
MNAGDIEKLKGIYAGDFATLGSLSKLSPTRTPRRRELIAGFLRNQTVTAHVGFQMVHVLF